MARRPRIAYLSTASGLAGAERQVHDVALRMRAKDWDVAAVSLLPIDVGFEALSAEGILTSSLHMRRGVADPRALLRLVAWLREWKPDVVHAHLVHAILLARASRPLVRTPVLVSTIHSQHQGSRWRYAAFRMTDRWTDLTTAVSGQARLDSIRLGAVPAERISVVPNGVDLAVFHADEASRARTRAALGLDEEFAWLAAGRLVPAKDYRNLIDAFGRLVREGPTSRLFIAGSGPLEAELREHLDRAGLADAVRLLGERSDVPDLMQAADGFVMSSAWEGLPLSLLEAAASSLPIVATDVGGNRETVVEGVSGVIVPAGSPDALAAAMRTILASSAADRLAMGRAGRDHIVTTFDIDAVTDRWDALYRELLLGA